MGTRWINSWYAVAMLLAIGPFLWGVSFKPGLLIFNKYRVMLKNRKWIFAANIILGFIFTVLVIANKEKFLWYIDLATSAEFRPYDNYYPTLIITFIMILSGVAGIMLGFIKRKEGPH